jgi:hypothetical protein
MVLLKWYFGTLHLFENATTTIYLDKHKNVTIEYYLENENPHVLLKTISANSSLTTIDEVFDYCWSLVIATEKGKLYFESLQRFLIDMVRKYSFEL